MNIIKLNNTEFQLQSYSRNTYFNEGGITSNASCNIKTPDTDDLMALGEETITSIQIKVDNNVIYELENITAKVDNINEYFDGQNMNFSINFMFSNA